MKKQLLLMALACKIIITGNAQTDLVKTNFNANTYTFSERKALPLSQPRGSIAASFKMEKSPEHWKKLRNAGLVLTSVGVGSIAGGAALIAIGNDDNNKKYNYVDDITPGDRKIAFGVLGIAGGITALGGGITMWAIGNNRLRKYTDRVHIDVGGNTTRIAYRF